MKVSIIVPVYNAEPYLKDSLDSIVNQTYRNWECVLVNDGSIDKSQQIIEEYCAKDPRFKYFTKANEKSAALAREYALKRIESEWVVFIDADDAIAPDCMEKLVKRQQETNADMVIGTYIGCKNELDGEVWRLPLKTFDRNQIISGREACLLTLGGWQIGGVTLHKKEIMDGLQSGPYMNSDEYLQRERLLRVKKVAFTNALYYVRNNVGTSDRISVRMFDRTLVDIQLEQFVYENFSEREDKIKALAWQRLFNMVYLCADYKIHELEFSEKEREHALDILRRSYNALDKKKAIKYYPAHALLLLSVSFKWFMQKSKWYVQYKRSHGGTFFYQ